VKESIVSFSHGDQSWKTTIDSVMDPTRNFGYYGDADLQEYLRRPVKILDQAWTVTTGSFDVEIDPWTLFLEDANVRKRVEGYRLFQGTLNLRIAINGGPLFYAKAIAAYEPMHLWNGHSWATSGTNAYIQQLSQYPHVFLDATTSEGGELVCPFFCNNNWIDLIGDGYKDMGVLKMTSINDLLHANSSSGTVNISVYAWMDNVKLAAPTASTYGTYTTQSGIEPVAVGAAAISLGGALIAWLAHCKTACVYAGNAEGTPHEIEVGMEPQAGDEYGTGIISKPASTVAKVMGALSNIPSLKPFARPSEMVADTIGKVAHVFGFSRPTILSNIGRVKNKAAGVLANTDQHEAVVKLSLDSKQELSIDPRTVGLSDVDEMAFDYIKQKEAYLTTFEWLESDGGGGALGNIVVGPETCNHDSGLSYPTPMYTVTLPFEHWRGSIKYRFQLVASQLHRGRMRIVYDPYDPLTTSPGENVVYSRIVDLATNRDFEMEVAWNHPRSWLNVNNVLSGTTTVHDGTITPISVYHNGCLRLEVVNELTSPDPALAQPVYINVFVSAGEDYEVANPNGEVIRYCEYEAQSGVEYEPQADGEELIDESDGVPESPSPIAPIGREDSPDAPHVHVFHGEAFKSIRSLLKRYCYHQSFASSSTEYRICESNFPVEPGQSVGPRHITAVGANPSATAYNYTNMTYLNWFKPCYLGWRGGLRSKYFSISDSPTLMVATRITDPVSQAICGITPWTISDTDISKANDELLVPFASTSGSDAVIPSIDGALEVEFPFYTFSRFAPGRKFLDGSDMDKWLGNDQGHEIFVRNAVTSQPVMRYVAAGDDFSLFFFVGQPGVQYRAKPASGSPTT
jgi:uncharacterized Zn-finger protein